jgi:hydrogenase maturation protease
MPAPGAVNIPEVLVIGIGNDYRCDDAAGLWAARALQKIGKPGTRITEASGDGTALLDLLRQARDVIVVDAVSSGTSPGTILRYDLRSGPPPALFSRTSTHAFGIAEAVELARTFNSLPERLILFGIEGKWFGAGTELSEEVSNAIPLIVQSVLKELASFQSAGENTHA